MFSISWSEAGSVVTNCRETIADAVALVDVVVTRRLENVVIIDVRDMRTVSTEQLYQIAGTELIGKPVYRPRPRRRR